MIAHLVDVLQVLLLVLLKVAVHDAGGGGDELFVHCDPPLDAALEVGKADLGIFQIGVDHLAVEPAAEGVHQRLRTLEVIESNERFNPFFQQIVDEPVVKGQPLGVGGAGGIRHDAAPGKAHPVDLQAQLGHQIHVLFPVVVMVCGHFVVGDAGAACPQIGGGNAFAAFVVTALYLKGAGRRAPEEIGGENHLFRQVDNTSLFDFMVSRSQTLSKSFWEKPNR